MRWYSITSLGIDGKPIKREILFRKSLNDVHRFMGLRAERHRLPEEVHGYWISDITDEEEWDFDFDEPRERDLSGRAIEVPLVFGEELNPR